MQNKSFKLSLFYGTVFNNYHRVERVTYDVSKKKKS